MKNKLLAESLTENYHTGENLLCPLSTGAKLVYRIQRREGADWILRVFPNNPDGYLARGADELAQMLLYFEAHDYPTERVIRTRSRQSTASGPDCELLVTTDVGKSLHGWVGEVGQIGDPAGKLTEPELGTEIWGKLGTAMAQLHVIPIDRSANLPKAGMLPARELTWVSKFVAELAEEVPPEWQAWYDELASAISSSHHCEDLDRVLIHCDPNLGNAALNADGDVVFIDWDVVGLGPAVFDLGCLLCNCVTGNLEPDIEAIHAVMNGYLRIRALSELERERLSDTVSSQMLVTLGGYLPSILRGEIGEDEPIYGLTYAHWQAKYRASARVAAIAQACGMS